MHESLFPASETAPETYIGWVRRDGGDWQSVCRSSTESSCWGHLLLVEVPGKSIERLVLPLGKDPAGKTRSRRKT